MFVGIVGRSGSGKSTLSKLLQRLYQVESGRILIDGFDIKSADLASLRQQIGVVLQEFPLQWFHFGKYHPRQSRYHSRSSRSGETAVAHDFISELPQGYETNVGERHRFIWWAGSNALL